MKLVASHRIQSEVRDVCAVFEDGTVWLAEGYDMDVGVLTKLALLRAKGVVPPERMRAVRPIGDIAKAWREAEVVAESVSRHRGDEVDGRARKLLEEGLRRAAEVRASDLVFLTNDTAARMYLIVNGRRYQLGDAMRTEEGLAAMRVAFYVKEEGSEQTSYQERASQGFAIRDSHRLHVPTEWWRCVPSVGAPSLGGSTCTCASSTTTRWMSRDWRNSGSPTRNARYWHECEGRFEGRWLSGGKRDRASRPPWRYASSASRRSLEARSTW